MNYYSLIPTLNAMKHVISIIFQSKITNENGMNICNLKNERLINRLNGPFILSTLVQNGLQ